MYQFTKLVLSIFPTSNDKFDLLSIALFCITGNLTIFAFGYPYTYDAIEKLSEISKTISDKIRNYKRISLYKIFLIIIFILDFIFLIICCIKQSDILYKFYIYFSIILLSCHIIWIMEIYKTISNIKQNPFLLIYNKKIEYKNFWIVTEEYINSKRENNNDYIQLVTDIILHKIKNDLDNYQVEEVYLPYLIALTAQKFDTILTNNYNLVMNRLSKYISLLGKMQYINQKIVQYKNFDKFIVIDSFFLILLRYQENLTNIDEEIKKEYPLLFNKLENTNYNFPILKRNILETYYYIWLYRIENNCFRIYDINAFFWLFYIVTSYDINISSDKNICFNIITKLIDKDISLFCYKEIFKKFSTFVTPTYSLYNDIKIYHILILSYLIFSNKYEIAYSYLKMEENEESLMKHTFPQIPNTINNILISFLGKHSIFSSEKTFDINISSIKYKFYTLFLMLLYSKRFAKKSEKYLNNYNKHDWRYEAIKNDIKNHSEFTLKMEDSFVWEDIFAPQNIKNYTEYLLKFKEEKLLIQTFEFEQKDIDFVENILSKFIKILNQSKRNLLKININELVKQPMVSKYVKVGDNNLKNYLDIVSYNFINNLKNNLPFNLIDNDKNIKSIIHFPVFKKICNKEQFLSYKYERTYFADYFYPHLLNTLAKYCQNISDINDINENNLESFSVLSNIEYDFQFTTTLGIKRENLKIRNISEGFSDVKALVLDKKEIPISEKNRYFTSCANNEESIVLIIDISTISISIGNEKEITFEELSETNDIKICNNTEFNIYLKKDKIGYCIRKKQITNN